MDSTNVITVRIIKSFEYRTSKNLILHIDLSQTSVGDLKNICRKRILEESGFKAYRNVDLDTLKIYTHAFGHKTQNLIINLEDEGFLNDDDAMLDFVGVKHETELSFFNKAAYDAFAANPEIKWEHNPIQ
ncbi:hypothetical protein GGI07_005848 [Coemansia sp. Benny D115]|nr:hypothetical protein GGI07_005848 [Coemansia sp. Benny D115]